MQAIKSNFPTIANVVAIVFAAASLLVFVWGFDYIDELYVKVLLTLLAVVLLIAPFFEGARAGFEIDKLMNAILWMSLPTTLLVLALINTYLERLVALTPPWIALNFGILLVSALSLCIYWKIAWKKPLLMMAAALTVGVACLWSTLEIWETGIGVELLLLPLPFIMFAGIPWVATVWLSLERVTVTRHRPVLGPAMESLLMFLLAVPFTIFVILLVRVICGEGIWVVIAGIIASFLFSNAVATPFRELLRGLGRLDEQQGDDYP